MKAEKIVSIIGFLIPIMMVAFPSWGKEILPPPDIKDEMPLCERHENFKPYYPTVIKKCVPEQVLQTYYPQGCYSFNTEYCHNECQFDEYSR